MDDIQMEGCYTSLTHPNRAGSRFRVKKKTTINLALRNKIQREIVSDGKGARALFPVTSPAQGGSSHHVSCRNE